MLLGRRLARGMVALSIACAPGPPRQDPAAFEAEMMAADRAFNEASQRRGSDGWVEHFDAEGVFIQAGAGEIRGLDAIRASMLGLDTPGLELSWDPEWARGSDDGTLGYTVGGYVSIVTSGADTLRATGRYVTIWRRQPDGALKVVMDLGNPVD